MCTLTWTSRREGTVDEPGYQLWFNRDELIARGPELPPRIQEAESGALYIAPEDSEAGGTWIAVNERGMTVALLNGYVQPRGPKPRDGEPAAPTSRGVLVRRLAGISSSKEALAELSPKRLREFRPAVVFVKTPGEPALVARWDGLTSSIDVSGERQLPLTSSSFEQDEVQLARRELYRRMVTEPDPGGDAHAPDPGRLAEFQRYVDPVEGATHLTPTMRRGDAATRSRCTVDVTESRVVFGYQPILVEGSAAPVHVELPRVGG